MNCNFSLLEQAFVNLLDNAIKYSNHNKVVKVETLQKEKEIIVKIKDEGSGIPDEHVERIFERFYRVDKGRSRAHGGTGLGLAIVKHIVMMHHGYIKVDSTLGKGSTFTIILPVS